jgi:UrcA family protein
MYSKIKTAEVSSVSGTFRHLIAAAIIGALALGSAGVRAGDSPETRSITVKFGDLNLSTPQGAAALYNRIRAAARTVCSADSYPFAMGNRPCVHKAIADAVTKVNRMELYTVYNEHNKPPLPAALLSQSR